MKQIIFFILFSFFLFAKEFVVASYNVENFFDLKYDGTEYKEFIPNTKTWNKRAFYTKLKNISKVINDLKADIIGLQEIESDEVLKLLQKKCHYKYRYFIKKRNSAIGIGLLSNYPILKKEKILVKKFDYAIRDILKATILIDNKPLIIYVNHWKSKRGSEKNRIASALSLKKDIDNLPPYTDFIILGDLNSNYDEFLSIKNEKKLNDTYGITGINHILNTIIDNRFVSKQDLFHNPTLLYNLWLELNPNQRCSKIFKGFCETPDNILISAGLVDNIGITYINKSFNVFKKQYLFRGKYIKRWDFRHFSGYSDHLPIYAKFSSNSNQNYQQKIKKILNISNLYNLDQITSKVLIKNVCVIAKFKNSGVIKQINNRAIFVYKALKGLNEGECFDINVYKIKNYYGLKEITSLEIIKKLNKIDPKKFYINANTRNIFDESKVGEVVFAKGKYDGKYLKFKGKKIKLYFKKWIKKPPINSFIYIKKGVLNKYKNKFEIIVF